MTARVGHRRDAEKAAEAITSVDWNFWDARTDYLTHAIHRYSGKFIPQIASQAIRLLTKPGDCVLDIYCGSGTTLLEAGLLGRAAVGVDLNPLAVLISRVKTTAIHPDKLNELNRSFSEFIGGMNGGDLFSPAFADAIEGDDRFSDPWFRKWFGEAVLRDLVYIHRKIIGISDLALRDVALVAFSEILRRSSNAHQGYPNVMFDRRATPRARPGRNFLKALSATCAAVGSLDPHAADLSKVRAEHGDATDLRLQPGSIDAIISHPPYIGSIPYAEYGALSLKWLGEEPKLLDGVLTGGKRQSRDVVARFEDGYSKMFLSAYRVLRRGGAMFLLVGNPVVKGKLVDLADMTVRHATEAGFSLSARTMRSAKNRRSNQMGDETILVFARP